MMLAEPPLAARANVLPHDLPTLLHAPLPDVSLPPSPLRPLLPPVPLPDKPKAPSSAQHPVPIASTNKEDKLFLEQRNGKNVKLWFCDICNVLVRQDCKNKHRRTKKHQYAAELRKISGVAHDSLSGPSSTPLVFPTQPSMTSFSMLPPLSRLPSHDKPPGPLFPHLLPPPPSAVPNPFETLPALRERPAPNPPASPAPCPKRARHEQSTAAPPKSDAPKDPAASKAAPADPGASFRNTIMDLVNPTDTGHDDDGGGV
eukprot:gnl/Trimastix_PCT/3145.p1 GENE.gnl/Trimastix_PCT/3145~~gnl/Trimastix_PCT/3145.p1  ORF type:complete len:258 (+),score=44.16 gnl/Trimastix_PCT/3145:39-812(+)